MIKLLLIISHSVSPSTTFLLHLNGKLSEEKGHCPRYSVWGAALFIPTFIYFLWRSVLVLQNNAILVKLQFIVILIFYFISLALFKLILCLFAWYCFSLKSWIVFPQLFFLRPQRLQDHLLNEFQQQQERTIKRF